MFSRRAVTHVSGRFVAHAALPLAFLVAVIARPAGAQITLSHITENRMNNFDFAGGDYWDTQPGNGAFDIFAISGNSVTGTIFNAALVEPNLVLTPGSAYTFTLLTEPGGLDSNAQVALNLYLNGSSAMQISAYNTYAAVGTTPTAVPSGHTSLNTYSNATTPGALTYTAPNGTTATVTSLRFFASGVDRVTSNSANPSGTNDYATQFTLSVTSGAAPDVGTLALVVTGMAPVRFGAARVRRRGSVGI